MSKAGTVLGVGSVTANFQSETPLHPTAREFLLDAFDRGWADPEKTPRESRQAAILRNEAKEIFASHLQVPSRQLEFLADPSLGFHLGISGLLTPDSTLFYSGVDRSEVFAVAGGCPGEKLPVSLDGSTVYPAGKPLDVLAWQAINGETGIRSAAPHGFEGKIFVDATAAGHLTELPHNWSTALWSSKAWQGPAGIGIFAVADRSTWRNPLPHLDNSISNSEYSLPLAMASALALQAHVAEYAANLSRILEINTFIRNYIAREIPDVDIAGNIESTVAHLLSFSILYTDARQLVDDLDRRGFAIDSGSACSSANLEPSHVLAAMGLLTHGNIRITLHNNVSLDQVQVFLESLKEIVEEKRK